MNCKKTNKNIIKAVLALALVLVCAASVVSCNKESDETMFPEYTGDLWTVAPSDGMTVETGHIEIDSNDNIIDANFFTDAATDKDSAESDVPSEDSAIVESADLSTGDPSETTAHVIGAYDGIHNWPSDEFDHSGYKPLNPVTKPVTD